MSNSAPTVAEIRLFPLKSGMQAFSKTSVGNITNLFLKSLLEMVQTPLTLT